MKIVVAALLVAGALGWGLYGGGPVDLVPGSKMPAGLQVATGEAPRQISQILR